MSEHERSDYSNDLPDSVESNVSRPIACRRCGHGLSMEVYSKFRAIDLANYLAYMALTAHLIFTWHGKTLTIPEWVYVAIFTPYFGKEVARMLKWFKK